MSCCYEAIKQSGLSDCEMNKLSISSFFFHNDTYPMGKSGIEPGSQVMQYFHKQKVN